MMSTSVPVKREREEVDQTRRLSDSPTTHQEAMEMVHATLTDLVHNDLLLQTIPTPLTLEEVNSLVALERGLAMTVNVRKADDEIMPIIVEQTATVLHLKKAVQRYVTLRQARLRRVVHISWRYIWRTYVLYYAGQKLDKDHKKLKDYGISNKDEVTFVKRLRER